MFIYAFVLIEKMILKQTKLSIHGINVFKKNILKSPTFTQEDPVFF